MSSQRRAPRSGARGGAQENGEERDLWQNITSVLAELSQKEKEAKDIKQKIFDAEEKLTESKKNGRGMLFFLCSLLLAIIRTVLKPRRTFCSGIVCFRMFVP